MFENVRNIMYRVRSTATQTQRLTLMTYVVYLLYTLYTVYTVIYIILLCVWTVEMFAVETDGFLATERSTFANVQITYLNGYCSHQSPKIIIIIIIIITIITVVAIYKWNGIIIHTPLMTPNALTYLYEFT
jgi:hypothetical protein